ncbi:cytochrome P450 2A13-like isoform X2 [Pseudophryne corroboree]|uniref:cytochrome P450 2A13-like isoform X2 n=1 Tax=Pseudophryne corroboree TaxID=495146 RepID=UPI003081D998
MDLYSLCTVILVVLISCLMAIYGRMMLERVKLPPGPTPLPIIGTLHKMNVSNIVHSLMKLKKTYGDIFTIYEGNRPCVVLCGYEAIKETLIDKPEEFSGRAYFPSVSDFTKGDELGFSNGEKWKELRNFCLITLCNFGMGKRSIEERIKEEAGYLIDMLRQKNGSPIDPKHHIHCSVANVICSVLFGKRFDYQDEELQKLVHCSQYNVRIMSNPWGLEEKKNPNYYNKNTMLMNIMVLIFAGTETMSNTLTYLFLLLLKHPNVAEKVCQEIDDVIGCRPPNYEDRYKMPYTEAFIHEAQRYADVVPLSLPYELTKATQLRNYTFRKGTVFIALLSSVHNDKTRFNNPEHFNPNNFLDENGKFKNNNALMPFSAGKRICPGMSLAVMEIFLYVITMLQNFTIKSPVPPEEISVAPVGVGLAHIPPNYEICLLPRSCSPKSKD